MAYLATTKKISAPQHNLRIQTNAVPRPAAIQRDNKPKPLVDKTKDRGK
jgi:hypothetical protein